VKNRHVGINLTHYEIDSFISTPAEFSLIVDLRTLQRPAGIVRATRLSAPAQIDVEFDLWGVLVPPPDGIYFCAEFGALADAIASAEEFLGRPVSSWHNFSRLDYYPRKPSPLTLREAPRALQEAVRTHALVLPPATSYTVAGEPLARLWRTGAA